MAQQQYPAANPQALADLEGKDRQGKKATINETTINLKPYVNCKLTDPLTDKADQKERTLKALPTGVHIPYA
jgi:polyphosphate kinase 2 (PPK2 family)